jgi:hypothetical protein
LNGTQLILRACGLDNAVRGSLTST